MNKSPKYRGAIRDLKLSPDGKWLAIAGDQGTTVWNLASDSLQSSREGVKGWSIAFSPDGTRLAAPCTATKSVASTKDTVQVWDVATSKALLSLTGHKINVASLAFSPNGQLVATGGHDNSIRLWDAAAGAERFVLESHLTAVSSLAFSPEGRTLASGGSDGTLKLWHVETGQEMSSKQFSSSAVTSLVFSPAGDALAIGFADASSSMHLWRAKPLAEIDAWIATAAKAK
jgi:WD40 repeat protein